MAKRFLDTNILLTNCSDIGDCVVSSKSIEELESIKTSIHKDNDIKYKARQAVRAIKEQKPEIIVVQQIDYDKLNALNLEITNDNLIICSAFRYTMINVDTDLVFVTNDILAGLIAEKYFGLTIESLDNKKDDIYKGYKMVTPTDEELASIYEKDNSDNIFNCLVNEYAIIQDSENHICDVVRWNGEQYVTVNTKPFKSRAFGNTKPLDEIQRCAFDSIISNDITVLYGRSGSGKTTIPLSYIMSNVENQKFKKCVIIYDFETLKGAKTLGFTPGTLNEKIITQGAIGNILSSKFGDMSEVERLLASGMIEIIPTANIRGYEVSSDEICFVTEGQNLDTYTLKTIIQRCKAGAKIIIEGDIIEQHDNNREVGLLKMIDIFKGYKSFGCVKLKNNYRSEIGELADML